MILGPDGELRAVLDWELATLGDTLADLGWLISSWVEPGEPVRGPFPPPTSATGFPTRAELVERYAQATGRDLSDLPYYLAFARWRSGVHRRGRAQPLPAGGDGRGRLRHRRHGGRRSRSR